MQQAVKNEEDSANIADLGTEYKNDLELAIAMSLEETGNNVYSTQDYQYESAESLKLNKDQRKQLQNAAKGPARAYMIEYAGLNDEEVEGIMEKTQVETSSAWEMSFNAEQQDEEQNEELKAVLLQSKKEYEEHLKAR